MGIGNDPQFHNSHFFFGGNGFYYIFSIPKDKDISPCSSLSFFFALPGTPTGDEGEVFVNLDHLQFSRSITPIFSLPGQVFYP